MEHATGTSQIIGLSLVTTTIINSVITIRNLLNNITITGGNSSVFATLIIKDLIGTNDLKVKK